MAEFNFDGKDNFDVLEVLIKLLMQFKESKPADTATTADDLAKFFIRWKDYLAVLSAQDRESEVERVLRQLAIDKVEYDRNLKGNIENLKGNIENLKGNIEKDLLHHRELVKKDMRFYLFLGSIVVSILLVIDIKYGAGVLEMLKNMATTMPK